MSHDLRITARAEKKAEIAPVIENKFTIQGGSKLEVFDEEGGKLYEGEFKSFTANFLKLLYGSMVGSGTAKAKDLTNTNLPMNSFPQNTFNISGGANLTKFGVVVGTNTEAVSVSDYSITVSSGLTLNATAVGVSSVGADSISVEIFRQIGNSTGSTVNLKEAGLICGSEDEVDSNVLIARDLLDITLESGKKSVWRYTINFNFANDIGGFVKIFADKMFGGIFEEATSSAGWSGRAGFGCVVFNNKIWVIGGVGSSFFNDVWSSEDGVTWARATSSAGWSGRRYLRCVVFNNKIWVLGGESTSFFNDVWSSEDGVTWARATSSAGWSRRANFGCVVFNNKIWVLGGTKGSNVNDVFESIVLAVVLLPGSSDSSFSATATALGAVIANGSGSGQLVYGAMPGIDTLEPTVSGNKTKMSIAREFTNNSGADITVREVGLFSGTDMLARLILANPVTILNGQSDVITVDFETEV